MALAANDLFVIQKAGGALAKLSAQDLNTYLEGTDSVTYKGAADFGASLDTPPTPNTGDLWINTGDTDGAFAWGNLSPIPDPVSAGDRVIWNGTSWDYFSDGVQDAGVETVVGGAGITVDSSSPANPVVNADYASETEDGIVQIATDAEVAAGTEQEGGAYLVVTAKQLRATNDAISSAGGGTVTNVTGTAPISVTNNTSTPLIVVAAATDTSTGVVRFAEDAEANAGLRTDCAITPAQLAANVPTDKGVESITEGGVSIISGALEIGGTASAVTIGVNEEIFCPYSFTALPDA